MADKSKIEWTDATWNPIRGCSRVSEGCRNCYAERQAIRQSGPGRAYEKLVKVSSTGPQWTGVVRLADEYTLSLPLRWRRGRRIFVNSMSDLFHENVQEAWIDRIFGVMASCPQHTFQILTKRADRMFCYFNGLISQPLKNVSLGISAEDQPTFNDRHAYLRNTPSAARFISYEPALGPLDLKLEYAQLIDWVIAGGESGPGARPANPDWFRSVRDQCVAAGVPFFFKQWGEWLDPLQSLCTLQLLNQILAGHAIAHDYVSDGRGEHSSNCPNAKKFVVRVGKKAAGRMLDGREWNEFPEAR